MVSTADGSVKQPGQIIGGRWKPLHYELARSAFAPQLATCNTAAACFVTNDAPLPFEGAVTLQLHNIMTGKSAVLSNRTLSLHAGAGVTQWFCASAANRSTVGAGAAVSRTIAGVEPTQPYMYLRHVDVLPSNKADFYIALGSKVNATAACEVACSRNESCTGFSEDNKSERRCWIYGAVRSLARAPGDSFYQKPGTPPLPIDPPSPPAPTPPPSDPTKPPQLSCGAWVSSAPWEQLNCSKAQCLLSIDVSDVAGLVRSHNTILFAPPRGLRLPRANVSATVGEATPGTGRVPITLRSTATALYVVLTTAAAGRFSDSAFVLHGGEPRTVDFVAWGAVGAAETALLHSSLRVEHLAEMLP